MYVITSPGPPRHEDDRAYFARLFRVADSVALRTDPETDSDRLQYRGRKDCANTNGRKVREGNCPREQWYTRDVQLQMIHQDLSRTLVYIPTVLLVRPLAPVPWRSLRSLSLVE